MDTGFTMRSYYKAWQLRPTMYLDARQNFFHKLHKSWGENILGRSSFYILYFIHNYVRTFSQFEYIQSIAQQFPQPGRRCVTNTNLFAPHKSFPLLFTVLGGSDPQDSHSLWLVMCLFSANTPVYLLTWFLQVSKIIIICLVGVCRAIGNHSLWSFQVGDT